MCEIHRRFISSLSTGRVLDDCVVDDVPDAVLGRFMDRPDDIRVELTMKGAVELYSRAGADVSEVYSQPRIRSYSSDGVWISLWMIQSQARRGTRESQQRGPVFGAMPETQNRSCSLVFHRVLCSAVFRTCGEVGAKRRNLRGTWK